MHSVLFLAATFASHLVDCDPPAFGQVDFPSNSESMAMSQHGREYIAFVEPFPRKLEPL